MSKYARLGVDVEKKGIEAFKDSVSGIYRHAFCEIHPESGMPGYGFVHHADGAGSKPVQNYLNWKETGNIEAFRGIAQDTLAMNIGDAFCVGVPDSGSFVDYVAINGFHVPKKEVLQILADDWKELFGMLKGYNINIKFAGGETADLPDQLKTIDVSAAIYARYKLDSVITGENIKPGNVIIGLASGGQAKYEKRPSGPIMSNGLTLGRHVLMKPEYGTKYPEILEPGKEYTGRFAPTDTVEGIDKAIGEELTKPTRIFAPVFKGAIETFGNEINGIVFNTGSGNTKCRRVGNGIKYVKNNTPEPPAIFRLIKEEGKVSWREMFMDFNMGIGAELFVNEAVSDDVSKFIRDEFGIGAFRIGECRKTKGPNKVRMETEYGNFNY